ncbi:MAG: DNA mismatch repair protein MutS, partial [Chlamydiia bacterium]|nr:DNA mismatch repair protein MutS [Chlamydiia bacterium]
MTPTLDPSKMTPMMAQWHSCKQLAKDAVLFFRMGDFYEAFYDDAELVARELELSLTQRQGTPMAGVPHHSAESYIDRLVAKGYRVAVAEQVEDPKQAKGLVKREIVRVVTPGTALSTNLVSEKSNNYFAALCTAGQVFGLAFVDLSTAEFRVIEFYEARDLLNELARIHPSECLVSRRFRERYGVLLDELRSQNPFALNVEEDWHFE